jgi:hypothetical protein
LHPWDTERVKRLWQTVTTLKSNASSSYDVSSPGVPREDLGLDGFLGFRMDIIAVQILHIEWRIMAE